jgi:hypothetical protein
MSSAEPLPYRAGLQEYQREAEALWDSLQPADQAALWRFKWEHPRFRGRPVGEVASTALNIGDAQAVVAREYGFEDWAGLAKFTMR